MVQSVEKSDHVNGQAFVPSQEQGAVTKAPDPWRLPLDLDPEWIAFEVYTEAEDSDEEFEADTTSYKPTRPSRHQSLDPQMRSALSRLSVNTPLPSSPFLNLQHRRVNNRTSHRYLQSTHRFPCSRPSYASSLSSSFNKRPTCPSQMRYSHSSSTSQHRLALQITMLKSVSASVRKQEDMWASIPTMRAR